MTRDPTTNPLPATRGRNDLRLALARHDGPPPLSIKALRNGRPIELAQARGELADMLREARTPVWVGLNELTLEGLRELVRLARAAGLRLVADPRPERMSASALVAQSATLAHLAASAVVVWVGEPTGPVAAFLAERIGRQERCPADLATVLSLRGGGDHPLRKIMVECGRVAVVLTHDCDPRVVRQWHKLAAGMQDKARVAVMLLPSTEAGNARGALEVLTWLTGVAPTWGGLDFRSGSAVACGPAVHDADLIIDARLKADGVMKREGRVAVVRLGPGDEGGEGLAVVTPGLAWGLGGRVMRCDGVVLWLCDDPEHAKGDVTAEFVRDLAEEVEGGGRVSGFGYRVSGESGDGS